MRPAPVNIQRPRDIDAATALVRAGGVPLSGGQALIPAMRQRGAKPSCVVDLKLISDLSSEIEVVGSSIRIGALATVADLIESRVVIDRAPWLVEAGRRLGDVQVRNRATVVGNVCWADPRANFAVSLLACDAVLQVHGIRRRIAPISDLFAGFRLNRLASEIVTSIDVPIESTAQPGRYIEFSRQRNDLAVVNIAVSRHRGRWRLAAGGLARAPVRLSGVEDLLTRAGGATVESDVVLRVIESMRLDPYWDAFGSSEFKQHIASVLIARAWAEVNSGATDVT